jgi:hypothetical protein
VEKPHITKAKKGWTGEKQCEEMITYLDSKGTEHKEFVPTDQTVQLCSWWWVQIAPETCRAKLSRKK